MIRPSGKVESARRSSSRAGQGSPPVSARGAGEVADYAEKREVRAVWTIGQTGSTLNPRTQGSATTSAKSRRHWPSKAHAGRQETNRNPAYSGGGCAGALASGGTLLVDPLTAGPERRYLRGRILVLRFRDARIAISIGSRPCSAWYRTNPARIISPMLTISQHGSHCDRTANCCCSKGRYRAFAWGESRKSPTEWRGGA